MQELEHATDKFTNIQTTAARESTPPAKNFCSELPTYPQAICDLVKERWKPGIAG